MRLERKGWERERQGMKENGARDKEVIGRRAEEFRN